MVFAKALCVVSLLYAAIFGQTQSLKNDSYSEKRSVILQAVPQGQQAEVSRKANDLQQLAKRVSGPAVWRKSNTQLDSQLWAENYRGYLLYLLIKLWRTDGPTDVINSDKLEGSGLYFFFGSTSDKFNIVAKQDHIYPLYVGITSRPFNTRIREHFAKGVLHDIRNKKWPIAGKITNFQNIVVYAKKLTLPVAKFFEGMFLQSFNFPMNIDQNDKRRPGIMITRTPKVEDGYNHVKEILKFLLDNIKYYADRLYAIEQPNNVYKNFRWYQFKDQNK